MSGKQVATVNRPGVVAHTRAAFPENKQIQLEATGGLALSGAATLCDEKEILFVARVLTAISKASAAATEAATEAAIRAGKKPEEVTVPEVDYTRVAVADKSVRTALLDLIGSKRGDGAQIINLPTPAGHWASEVLLNVLRSAPKALPKNLKKGENRYEILPISVRFVGGAEAAPLVELFSKRQLLELAAEPVRSDEGAASEAAPVLEDDSFAGAVNVAEEPVALQSIEGDDETKDEDKTS